jgi:hypothetical protein
MKAYSDEIVYNRYNQVSRQIPQDVYQESAYETFNRMSPQERMHLVIRCSSSTAQNYDFPDFNQDGIDDRYQDLGI